MPTYEYKFDEGSGTTIAETNGGTSLTLTGGTWGTGYTQVLGASSQKFAGPNGLYYNLNTFSFALWIEFTAVQADNYRHYLNIGSGGGGLTASFFMSMQPSNGKFTTAITDGTNYTETFDATSPTPSVGTKYLICATYNRVGGAFNNILKIRHTSDGSTWYTNTNTGAALMQQINTYALRTNYNAGFESASDANAKYYRLNIYDGYLLTDSDMQNIFNAGSEGAISTGATILNKRTLGSLHILNLNSPPNSGLGVDAQIGSLATLNNSGVGETYLKVGSSATSWQKFTTI